MKAITLLAVADGEKSLQPIESLQLTKSLQHGAESLDETTSKAEAQLKSHQIQDCLWNQDLASVYVSLEGSELLEASNLSLKINQKSYDLHTDQHAFLYQASLFPSNPLEDLHRRQALALKDIRRIELTILNPQPASVESSLFETLSLRMNHPDQTVFRFSWNQLAHSSSDHFAGGGSFLSFDQQREQLKAACQSP